MHRKRKRKKLIQNFFLLIIIIGLFSFYYISNDTSNLEEKKDNIQNEKELKSLDYLQDDEEQNLYLRNDLLNNFNSLVLWI